jgi:hypothetical protein
MAHNSIKLKYYFYAFVLILQRYPYHKGLKYNDYDIIQLCPSFKINLFILVILCVEM